MVIRNNRKGQAAIEFLMTYGWMLLVVLIVGALIFSFVDFGSLLPNKLDLSNNLRGDPTGSLALSSDNSVKVVFRYNGAKRALIGPKGAFITTELGETCNATVLTNLDTKNSVDGTAGNETTAFLNGQDGLMNFDCSTVQGGLLDGDSLVGTIVIPVQDPKTTLEIPSRGSIRLQIN